MLHGHVRQQPGHRFVSGLGLVVEVLFCVWMIGGELGRFLYMKILVFVFGVLFGCGGGVFGADVLVDEKVLERVVFGSCYKAGKKAVIWDAMVGRKPDLFLFLGDNVYADTTDMGKMRAKYGELLGDEGFKKMKAVCPVVSTWDDHDYGRDDAGVEFEAKDGAKVEFMRAFGIGAGHPMVKRSGVYHSVVYGPVGKRVQVIMLDTRWFRSALKSKGKGRWKTYLPDDGPDATVIGAEQWAWLEKQLAEPAEVRIIGSSIQVVSEEHRYEKWANCPRDRKRLMGMVKKAGNAVILSGDRHMGEISREDGVLDVTSSGLTNAGGGYGDKNRHRVGERVGVRNFGVVVIDWSGGKPVVKVELVNAEGEVMENVLQK